MRKLFSLFLVLMATTATAFSSVVTFDADTDKGNATETAAAFTKVLDFTNNSKAMYYIYDPYLPELQIANFDGEYSVSFDILYIDQVMGGEFDMTNMFEEQTFLIHRNSPVKFAEFGGKIWQKNDTTYLTASILGLNSIQYEISMFYTVPTPTKTVTYTFNGLGDDVVDLINGVSQSGIFILDAMSADGQLMAKVNVERIENGSIEGTFYNDGKFDHNDFYPTDTWVKVWNASTKDYDEYAVQMGTMTVMVENKILTAVASFICDNGVQYDLTFITEYTRERFRFDSEEGDVEYTDELYSNIKVTDWRPDGYRLIELSMVDIDESIAADFYFVVDQDVEADPDIVLPVGVYPINASWESGTTLACSGIAPDGPLPSYVCFVDAEGYLDPEGLYCLVDGTVTVEKVDGKMKLTVDAFNSYDVSVSLKIVYDPGCTLTVLSNDATMGYVSGSGIYKTGEVVTISATSNQGYHFVQWSDGNTDNPRSLGLTQDTVLTAEFAPNKYTITTVSSDTQRGTTQGDTTVNYLEYITISATANYGYHFTQWNDANVENPRQVQVTGDTTYTATFDKNTYAVSLSCNEEQGSVEGVTSAEYLDTVTISATPNFGYHFVQWSDGVTDNPRTFVITQDTTFTAEFAPNKYTITTESSDTQRGTTKGDTTVNYLEYITISATASYGYHFTQWNDANVENSRQVQVTGDTTYTATFDKNTYAISLSCNEEQGSVEGVTSAEYLDTVTISATPNFGYHFVKWSDGSTDTVRTLVLTQDTILTAEFAQTFSGQCGDNLYWSYDETAKTVSITGSGKMYDYTATTQPWLLFKEEIKEVIIANTATSIGTSAFEGCIRLGKVSIGTAMVNIGANAFAGCTRLYDIYVYTTYPPFADESSFANYNVYLYIPCEKQRDYILDVVWGNFKFIECIGAESDETGGDDVTVNPGSNDVTITWPTEDEAETYSIVITKDGEVFCTLTFNSNGQLVSIAFAPGREGNHPVRYAEATANGYRFTVTGLKEGTKYGYNLDVKDSKNQTIQSYEGEFTTMSDVTTDMDNVTSTTNVQKLLRDGQLLIIRDGKTYNAQGVELK